MLRGKKEERPRKGRGNANIGIFDIPNLDTMDVESIGVDDEDDDALEAELMNILGGSGGPSGPRAPKPKLAKVIPQNLDAMVAASMKDIPTDEESGDEDDPDLIAELKLVTGEEKRDVSPLPVAAPLPTVPKSSPDIVTLLNERINNYKEAEANAKLSGDTAKSRRLGRGLKTLGELLKKAQKGLVINEEDIPLQVATGGKKPEAQSGSEPTPSASAPDPPLNSPLDSSTLGTNDNVAAQSLRRPAPPPPVPPRLGVPLPGLSQPEFSTSQPGPSSQLPEEDDEKSKTLALLNDRRNDYKKAALIAKRNGDIEGALACIKVVKQFDSVIIGVEAGQPVDLSAMPPPPQQVTEKPSLSVPQPKITIREDDTHGKLDNPPKEQEKLQEQTEQCPETDEPLTVLSALEQRMAKFKEQEESAKKDGNASKARRMGRIVKQYQDAIKLHKAGKPFPVDELPTPPGFPPIPVGDAAKKEPPAPLPSNADPLVGGKVETPGQSTTSLPVQPPPKSPVAHPKEPAAPPRKSVTRQEKQLAVLLERQKLFKEAALKAKQKGDIPLAKEYLRLAKGFDPLIEASNSGFPIDMDTIPVAPSTKKEVQDESGFTVVSVEDCLPGSDSEIFERLLNDLQSQFKMCMETRNHYKSMGDVASANRFEQLAVHTKRDLDLVRASQKRGDRIPRFSYEKRTFSIVRCNVDLGDNDLELSIIQGINYNVPNPKEVDTYVRFEFPGVNDDTKKDKTNVIYNTNNPSYNSIFNLPIQRTLRAFQRLFKRHAIKFEVWSKGGFLRSDILIGTVNVKLQPLETKCTIHDSFDLMDGRKAVGGKLEVKIRLRHPILSKQVEQVEEKWLVIS